MSWLSADDNNLVVAVHNAMVAMCSTVKGDIFVETSHGVSLTFSDLPPEFDFAIVAELVAAHKPQISDVNVHWKGHSLLLTFDIISKDKTGFYPSYHPVVSIPIELTDRLLETGFDSRHAPQDWTFTQEQIDRLLSIFYSRGSNINVPLISLVVDKDRPTWVECANTENVTYSFLEYLCSHVHVAAIVVRGEDQALFFQIGEGDLPPLLPQRL